MIHRLLGGMPRGDGRELLDRIGVGGSEGYDAAMLRQARDRHRAEDLRRAAFDRARGAADGLRLHEVQHPHSGRGCLRLSWAEFRGNVPGRQANSYLDLTDERFGTGGAEGRL